MESDHSKGIISCHKILLDQLVTRGTRSRIHASCMTEKLFVKLFRYETNAKDNKFGDATSSLIIQEPRERHAEERSVPCGNRMAFNCVITYFLCDMLRERVLIHG